MEVGAVDRLSPCLEEELTVVVVSEKWMRMWIWNDKMRKRYLESSVVFVVLRFWLVLVRIPGIVVLVGIIFLLLLLNGIWILAGFIWIC